MVFAAKGQRPTRGGTPSLVQTKIIKFPNNYKNSLTIALNEYASEAFHI